MLRNAERQGLPLHTTPADLHVVTFDDFTTFDYGPLHADREGTSFDSFFYPHHTDRQKGQGRAFPQADTTAGQRPTPPPESSSSFSLTPIAEHKRNPTLPTKLLERKRTHATQPRHAHVPMLITRLQPRAVNRPDYNSAISLHHTWAHRTLKQWHPPASRADAKMQCGAEATDSRAPQMQPACSTGS